MFNFFKALYYLIILTACFSTNKSDAQTNNIGRPVIPPSPQAASLGVYAVVPVDFYTGIPEIKIPLYDIKLKGFELNINLSYHSGGIRENSEASNVGLNWTLNAGGLITRTQRHKDDLGPNGFYQVNPSGRPCNDNTDQEPDMFYYNFAGKSGRFIIEYISTNNYTVRQQVKTELYIYFNSTTKTFKIIDENGVTYEFDQKEFNNTVCNSDGLNFDETVISSWFLTKITTATGDIINFNYTVTGNKFQNIVRNSSKRTLLGYVPSDLISTNYQVGSILMPSYYASYILPNNGATFTRYVYSNTDEVVLSSIIFPGGAIKVNTTPRIDSRMSVATISSQKISSIQIFKGALSGTLLKSYLFGYDYYSSGTTQASYISKRLRLTSVQESNGTATLPPYTFQYNSDVLPDKAYGTNVEGFITNRIQGLISQINYPTGGYSAFTFEPHFANMGARVKSTVQHDTKGAVNKREYQYIGGKQFINTTNGFGIDENQTVAYTLTGVPNSQTYYGSFGWRTTFWSDVSILSETTSSYLIGYDKVIELIGVGGIGGKTEIEFYNTASIAPDNVPAEVPNLNGFPKGKYVYAYKNGSFIPVTKHTYGYISYASKNYALNKYFLSQCNQLVYNYKINTIALASEEESYYDRNGQFYIKNLRNYTYGGIPDNHLQPTKIEESDSRGTTMVTDNKYVSEMNGSPAVYNAMLSKNLNSTLVEQTKKINGIVTMRNVTNFKDWYNNGKVLMPLSVVKSTSLAATPFSTLTFSNYNSYGNPTEIIGEDGITVSYIWSYENQRMIAEIVNAAFTNVAYTSFETEDKGNWSYNDAGRPLVSGGITGSRYLSLNNRDGYTVSKSGLIINEKYIISYWSNSTTAYTVSGGTSTSQMGKTINGWTYHEHKVTATSTTLTITGSGHIDEVRLYPERAQMNTYTYDPLIGLTSHCDANSQIIFYKYDGFARLSEVKDQDQNILKKICYSYAGEPENCSAFLSEDKSGNYIRNNCGSGYTGSTVYVSIPQGMFTSTISQADANQQAINYGQTQANANGTCTQSCSFSAFSGFGIYSSAISTSGSVTSFYITFNSLSGTTNWNNINQVATINGTCKPHTTIVFTMSESGRTWNVIITSSGAFSVQLLGGMPPQGTSPVGLTGGSFTP